MDFKPWERLPFWIVHLSAAFRSRFDEVLSSFELKAAEGVILQAIYNLGSIPLVELAKRMSYAHPSVLRHVDALEKKGLLVRQPHPEDRRIKLLKLTKAGEEIVPRIQTLLGALNEPETFGLTEDEYKTMLDLSRKIYKKLTAEIASESVLFDELRKLADYNGANPDMEKPDATSHKK